MTTDRPSHPIHLQSGKEKKVAIVFSCPGRREEAAGHPAAGTTGRNLETLLSLLNETLGREDLRRENVTITNAWPSVEYREKTGRSEAGKGEIIAAANVERLRRELEGVSEMVIFCGRKARIVSEYLELKHHPRFVYIDHLGLRGLCSIRKDIDGEPIVAAARLGNGGRINIHMQHENTRRRLAVVARSIVSQLDSPLSRPISPLPPGDGQG